jgi:DNA-binding CsgD family transcriptional regulator
MTALFEYEWMTGKYFIRKESLDYVIDMIEHTDKVFDNTFFENSQFTFWLFKARRQQLPLKNFYPGYYTSTVADARKAAELWKKLGCPYEQAIVLFEGDDTDKRDAISLVQKLGATAVAEKLKLEMSVSGLKGIPRGIRKSTQSNPALLTGREMEVLQLLKEELQNKEMAGRLFLSPRTIDNHITSILYKLEVNSRTKAVQVASRMQILN